MSERDVRFRMPDLLRASPPPTLEGVLAALVELGVARERIELVPVGMFRRYRGQLLGFHPAAGTPVRDGDTIRLYLAEFGLADRLPDGFVRPVPADISPDRVFDVEQGGFVDDESDSAPDGGPGRSFDPYEMARRSLDPARQLLWVLDRAVRSARRDILLHRRALEFLSGDVAFAERTLHLLGLDAFESGDDGARFVIQSLAGFEEAVGTLDEAAAFLGTFVGLPVRATEAQAGRCEIPPAMRTRLGDGTARLGRSCVPGRVLEDHRPGVDFHFGPLGAEEAGRRYSDRAGHARVEATVAGLVPASRMACVKYEIRPEERGLRPGAPAHGLLGLTTYLGRSVAVQGVLS